MFWNFWRKPEREREIFLFHDGKRNRKADPIAVYRALKDDKEFNLELHPSLVDEGDMEAIRITAAAVRSAFTVGDLDAGGLTEQECITLMLDYFDWVASVKKKHNQPLTLPEPSDTSTPPDCSEIPTASRPESSSIGSEPN